MTILIDLTVAGVNTGPFNLYSDADGYTSAFATNITRQQLLDGYPAVVAAGTTNIKLQSLSDICPNDTILPVNATTSTTSTSTSTTSTTTTLNCLFIVNAQEITTTTTTTAIPTILICNQNWTTKNLDVTTYSDGTEIPEVTDPNEWLSLTTGAWCYYNNDPLNGAIYGKLYNWYAVAGIYDAASEAEPTLRKSLAPTGYHVSSGDELQTLRMCLDPQSVYGTAYSGGRMKEPGTSLWNSPNAVLTPYSGFAALPGGYHYDYNAQTPSYGMGVWARFWSSTEYYDPVDDETYGTSIFILNDSTNCLADSTNKNYGMSVRLIKE